MKTLTSISLLYVISAAYDGLLGLAFLFAGPWIYTRLGITPPNHWGYVDFAAVLLVIFGMMFVQIARDPVKNQVLIPYGILLKIGYVGTVCWHWFNAGIPNMWKQFAVADTLFAILFLVSLRALRQIEEKSPV